MILDVYVLEREKYLCWNSSHFHISNLRNEIVFSPLNSLNFREKKLCVREYRESIIKL
jgi:hypothetical protein